ncbi:hypothetical protein, partial [Azospirillum brasilense]|uniref:hypothetical protein n=1 Tax=Azospirillum brasilense TaxID=192 RepID=UPI001FFF2EDB
MGRLVRKARLAMKWVAQTPPPVAVAAPASQPRRARPTAAGAARREQAARAGGRGVKRSGGTTRGGAGTGRAGPWEMGASTADSIASSLRPNLDRVRPAARP